MDDLFTSYFSEVQDGHGHTSHLEKTGERKETELGINHAERRLHGLLFLQKPQRWQDTRSFCRPHLGLEMNGLTLSGRDWGDAI